MKKPSFLSHIISILLLPFNVTIIIPALLLLFLPNTFGWHVPLPVQMALFAAGTVLILFGILLVVFTIRHFAKRGRGTLAPWNPPSKLVVSGPYQYTRNPMISGVACILLGEVLITGSLPLLLWFLYFTSVNYLYFILREEPLLEKKFGEEYVLYKKHVPRIVPKGLPWKQQ